MNIAVIGTRGIPNSYGGFEQFAENFSVRLAALGHQVTVYNSHKHPFQGSDWKGVRVIHCKDPEYRIGSAGQFVYDLNCILHARKQLFDIIVQLGYTSSGIWGWLLPKRKSLIITNMDGLEWMRNKYPPLVRRFLLFSERLAVRYSDYLIADSVGIKDYLTRKYGLPCTYISYGADPVLGPDAALLRQYDLTPFKYNMLIARLEPENNIEMILDGSRLQSDPKVFLVIGNHETHYGAYLKRRYIHNGHIRFINSTYKIEVLNSLRYYAAVYFHGHSVGGTNPSLIEAMASQALICAHNNIFNRSVLGADGYYFSDAIQVHQLLSKINKADEGVKLANNFYKVKALYSWNHIVEEYLALFKKALKEPRPGNQNRNKLRIHQSNGY